MYSLHSWLAECANCFDLVNGAGLGTRSHLLQSSKTNNLWAISSNRIWLLGGRSGGSNRTTKKLGLLVYSAR
jgi:hypothetical protein